MASPKYAQALLVACPACDAAVGAPCTFNNEDYRKTPHAERHQPGRKLGAKPLSPKLETELRKRVNSKVGEPVKAPPREPGWHVGQRGYERDQGVPFRRVPKKDLRERNRHES